MATVHNVGEQDRTQDHALYITLSSRLNGNFSDYNSTVREVLDMYISPALLAVGLIGNSLSILVLQQKTLRKSSLSFLLSSLAVADNIVLVTVLMRNWILATFDIDIRTTSIASCKILLFLMYFGSHLSSWTLIIVTFERLVAVTWPLHVGEYCSRRRMVVAWVAMSTCLLLINGHILWTAEIIEMEQNGTVCTFSMRYFHFAYEVFPWIDLSVAAITFFALFICNIVIIIVLTKARKTRNRSMTSTGSQTNDNPLNGVTMTLMTISLLYVLTVMPINIYLLDLGPNLSPSLEALISSALQLVYCINNSVNFFLYALPGGLFRNTLGNVCACDKV
jgi:growth hormone secretagogue receptor